MKRTKLLLMLDLILFVSIGVLVEPLLSLAVHEWLGLAMIPLIVIHILYAWQWIVVTLGRLGATRAWRLRINALLNTLLFITFVVTLFSGAMTSFIALPALGIPSGNFESWRDLHNQWSLYVQILVGLHIAMNWSWFVGAFRRHVLARPTVRGDAAIGALSTESRE